ncbi:hypothetical protein CCUS01_14038 [Colletotrichum cuscutae]|uniref:Uncharacterized protein n=1 Tax=Colletotrichum cuscutae TaxID=1209917 RepID=A0AAJ0DM02_9PEZI|nr:hypothetical protein CCUS01_14038 [Colletotrichum cuscutae]
MTEVSSGSRSSSPLVVDGPGGWQPGLLSSTSFTQGMEFVTPTEAHQTEWQDDESDPGLDDDQCSTKSMTADVLDYEHLRGRSYHSDIFSSTYWAPNDGLQSEAMDLCHSLFCEASNGKLFLAELPDNAQVSLLWIKQLSKCAHYFTENLRCWDWDRRVGYRSWRNSSTRPRGWNRPITDSASTCSAERRVVSAACSLTSPIGICEGSFLHDNADFSFSQIDDFNEPWTFKDNSLDYINMRFLTGSVRDWRFLVGEAYRCLKEGGILESSEPSFLIESDDGTVNAESCWYWWSRVFEQYGAQTGQTFSVVQEGIQRRALEEAHFSDIQEFDYKV